MLNVFNLFVQQIENAENANFRTGDSVLHQASDKRERRDVEERDEKERRRNQEIGFMVQRCRRERD